MALQSNIQIYIGGSLIGAFKELTLDQEIDMHHNLRLVCRRDVLERISKNSEDESKDLLGQTIQVSVSSLKAVSGYAELKFNGIVTEVKSTKGFLNQTGDLIVITANSNSILTDDGPHYASYSDVDLVSILNTVFQKYDRSKLSTVIQPKLSSSLHYSVQNGESSYGYASRLASQYGEWFYYDGEELIFGKPQNTDEVSLTYGVDLQEFSRNLRPISNSYSFFTNDYLTDDQHEMATTDVSGGAMNGYNGFASRKSQEMYPHKTNVFLNTYNDAQVKQRLDTLVEEQKKAAEVQQVLISGKSDNPGVSLGRIVKIQGGEGDQGKFRITKVKHAATENGKYVNQFEGVSIEQDVYPKTNIMAHPSSTNQIAVVTDNADPEGMSRIQVQFQWQKPLGEYTPWLRVMTPHSGGEKGFHFIPEIGEEVLIGFEGGNAERPFVLGAMYNGNANSKSWNTDKNDVKAIRTRSGHTIELNDTKGGEFITITDKNQNFINIDTANNNITITALEKMTFNAKNMELNVEENLDINVGNDKTERIAKNHQVHTSNSIEFASQTKSVNVNLSYVQSAGSASLVTLAGDLTMHAKGVSTLQGNADVKISKG
ncbi:phage baseplate assembly protein V [Aquimarina addita]|uniref:Phage baseplate assembly protein V n=1 Tax=Aquimarina addita TaxID=870485 RepID=A0ABP7X8U6_9FLAO